MKHPIRSVEELGLVIRAVRKFGQVRQDDLAALVGVSRQFAVDAEKGKPTIQLGRVLRLLKELGIELSVDIPQGAHAELEGLRLRSQSASNSTPTASETFSDATEHSKAGLPKVSTRRKKGSAA